MTSNSQITPAENAGARWPALSMLGYGTFGCRTPAGKRFHVRTALALVFMAVAMIGGAAWVVLNGSGLLTQSLVALVPGATFGYIAWEFRIYLASLDELARRIQFEAMAWTYLTGLVAATFIGGIALIFGRAWSPLWFNPMWFVFLEPVRGCWLYFIARRY